jgi:hypothetical protein
MKLSTNTVSILKNLASINSNIVLDVGSIIRTISEGKNILAKATIQEEFDTSFGIYDLNEFLGVHGMFEEPDIALSSDAMFATVSSGRQSVKYFFSDASFLTKPEKDVNMPNIDLKFTMTDEDINSLRKAAATLGSTDMTIAGDATGPITVVIGEVKNNTANSYSIDITADTSTRPDVPFSFVFNIGNYKFMSGNYEVSISSKLISHFVNDSGAVEYWVALEKDSTFGE